MGCTSKYYPMILKSRENLILLIMTIMQKHNALSFCIVTNDGQPQSSLKLIAFREIIAKALPNMDRPHIIRLLFDYRHESILACSEEGMIGGACFASFPAEKFVELAFLAVRVDKRIQGYGRKIMNKLKCSYSVTQLSFRTEN
jgi:histone acetyltransferase